MSQDRRVVRTKAALTRALFELLGEKEFSKISITELARRADVDRKTFYLHYQSADEVLGEFYHVQMQCLREAVEREDVFGEQVDIPHFFQVLNGVIRENLELYRQLAKGPAYGAFQNEVQDMVKGVIVERLSSRSDLTGPELELYGTFYASAVLSVYHVWLKGELQIDEDELAQRVGLALSEGLKQVAPV